MSAVADAPTVTPMLPTGFFAGVTRWMLILTLAVCVVVPHSFQEVTAGLLLFSFVLSILIVKGTPWLHKMIIVYVFGALITVIYIWVGYVNGATREAVNQTLIVYLVAPLVWIVIGAAVFQTMGLVRATRLLVLLSWLAAISVALVFYAFLTFGAQSVAFLSEDVNINVSEGYAGASLLVLGSLVFLAGALFAEPAVMRNKFGRIILLGGVVLCAVTSGRSALILAVPVGFAVGALIRFSTVDRETNLKTGRVMLTSLLLVSVAAAVIVAIDVIFETIDLSVVFGEFFGELASGGGSVRTEQMYALLDGVERTYGMGAGHGMGVPYIRNFLFPWRYEVIPLASMYRVGILGTIVYMLPFILYGIEFLRLLRAGQLRSEDIFMMGGFFTAALATATNPYIESFIFQWMYFLPVMSIDRGNPANKPAVDGP